MAKGEEEVALQFVISSTDNGDRAFKVSASQTVTQSPLGPARRVFTFNVYGTQSAQSQVDVLLPDSMGQRLWRGTQYNLGPNDIIYVIDDPGNPNATPSVPAGDYNLALTDASWNQIEWNFTPTLPDGTPIV